VVWTNGQVEGRLKEEKDKRGTDQWAGKRKLKKVKIE
jgi:hypothetical protein